MDHDVLTKPAPPSNGRRLSRRNRVLTEAVSRLSSDSKESLGAVSAYSLPLDNTPLPSHHSAAFPPPSADDPTSLKLSRSAPRLAGGYPASSSPFPSYPSHPAATPGLSVAASRQGTSGNGVLYGADAWMAGVSTPLGFTDRPPTYASRQAPSRARTGTGGGGAGVSAVTPGAGATESLHISDSLDESIRALAAQAPSRQRPEMDDDEEDDDDRDDGLDLNLDEAYADGGGEGYRANNDMAASIGDNGKRFQEAAMRILATAERNRLLDDALPGGDDGGVSLSGGEASAGYEDYELPDARDYPIKPRAGKQGARAKGGRRGAAAKHKGAGAAGDLAGMALARQAYGKGRPSATTEKGAAQRRFR
jgi:hypothetical protein